MHHGDPKHLRANCLKIVVYKNADYSDQTSIKVLFWRFLNLAFDERKFFAYMSPILDDQPNEGRYMVTMKETVAGDLDLVGF